MLARVVAHNDWNALRGRIQNGAAAVIVNSGVYDAGGMFDGRYIVVIR